MLVLSRKLGEKICIGHDITIMVVDIDRGKIKLGITAPDNVVVNRDEIREKMVENGEPLTMRCPDCRTKGLDCDRCDGKGVVPLEMCQWIEQGKLLRAKRLHYACGPQLLADAARGRGVSVEEYVRMERGCVPSA